MYGALRPCRFHIHGIRRTAKWSTCDLTSPVAKDKKTMKSQMHTYQIHCGTFSRSKWTIKDSSNEVIYTIHHERRRFKSERIYIYRGSPKSNDCVASVQRAGWKRNWHVQLHQTCDEISIHTPHGASSICSFEYEGHKYCWLGDGELNDLHGRLVAQYYPARFSWTRVGRLNVRKQNLDKLDVVVATAMAVQCHWKTKW